MSWRRLPELTRGYVIAVLSVAVTTLVVWSLRYYLDKSIFIAFAAPIVMAAWYGGRGPALFATLLGLFGADLIFLQHDRFLLPDDPRDSAAAAVFVIVGLIMVHLSARIRAARDEAQLYAKQLEDQAMELEIQKSELEQQTREAQFLREELEEAHETLKVSTQSQLAEAQALARLGSWDWNIETGGLAWSDEMYRLYGLEPGAVEIDYDVYRALLHPEDRDIAAEVIAHSLKTGEPFSYDHRVVRVDGVERIFHARGKVILADDRSPVRMFGTGQDVTDSRRAEAALRSAAEYAIKQATAEAAARHLNRVFSQAPVLIAVLAGPEHRFELVNEKGIEMIGVESLLGKTVREVMPEVAAQGFEQLLDMVFTTNQPFVGNEMYARRGDPSEGRGAYFNFVFQPLSDENGVYSVLVVANDVSDLVGARMTAEAAQTEAVAASRAKSDFLARMSHELRTPLAAIIGYGELLSDGITGPVNDEQKKQLHRIRWSANHLLAIIDEILTLARMEAGKENVEMRNVEVTELMESVASMAEPLAGAKGLGFSLHVPRSEVNMRTDPIKLRQVLLNLISNAVKYTEEGTVSVASEAENGIVHFVVSDTGVGVGEEHLEKIFEPFWQVEQTTTRRAGGTGLGLAVTRQFVELLGGKITVTSRLGEGSSFKVTLPVSPADE
ncbi:MAG: ATP-binding protein [Gemmatimonadales bacterium]